MAKGSSAATQQSTSEPWKVAQPFIEENLKQAQQLGQSGVAFQPYMGSLVSPFSQQTLAGLNQMLGIAGYRAPGAQAAPAASSAPNSSVPGLTAADVQRNAGMPPPPPGVNTGTGTPVTSSPLQAQPGQPANQNAPGTVLANNMGNVIRSGGLTPQQRQSEEFFWNVAKGNAGVDPSRLAATYEQAGANPAQSGFQSLAQGLGPSSAERNLAAIASGQFVNRSDPNFMKALDYAAEKARDAVDLGASASGRYGGAIHQGNVAKEVGNIYATNLADQYNRERQAQERAVGQIDTSKLGYSGQQLSALSGLGSTYGNEIQQKLAAASGIADTQFRNLANRMTGATNAFNAAQQGFENQPQAFQTAMLPGQTMAQIGGQFENLNTNQLNDQYRKFLEQRNAPREQAEWLNALYSGAGRLGGTTYGQSTPPQTNWLQTGLGYGMQALPFLFGL